MTLGKEPGAGGRFAPAVLPWIVAAAALALYLVTLNRWVSLGITSMVSINPLVGFSNLTQAAKIAGWTWQPEVFNPVYFLVTYPFHWLPAKWIPLALNLLSAACAAGTLGLLARSVALLPHDRTPGQRERQQSGHAILAIPQAWIPPVLAVLACGLQQTFWEHATNGTGEMFDLLLFAFVIWSLLEYRLDGREARLTRTAFVYGVGMTNNWAMIGFLPVFIAALIWIRGLRFFNLRFLGRMTLCGLAGLLLYLLLPVVNSFSDTVYASFWQALKFSLVTQKNALLAGPFSTYAVLHADKPLWTIALTSLLPVLIIGIRWRSSFGDTSKIGAMVGTLIFHIMSGLFLVGCLWVALDSPVSPRHRGFGIPFLTFYYLGALSIGYFSGYFLLIFGGRTVRKRRVVPWESAVNAVVRGLVWLLLAVVPVGLAYKNLPQIRATNANICSQYASRVGQSLPPPGAVLLSDDPQRLFLVQAELARRGKQNDYLFLDTRSLTWPGYHRFLHKRYPQRWAETVDLKQDTLIRPAKLIQLMVDLSKSSPLYYLHPSFGYYFEHFSLEPHGLVYKLKPYPTNTLFAPPPSEELIKQNEDFWARASDEVLKPLVPLISPPSLAQSRQPLDHFLNALHLTRYPNNDALTVGTFYSHGLNYWAVEMQRSGNLKAAADHFETALQLNPDNVVAQKNQQFNKNLRAGDRTPVPLSYPVEDEFGKYRSWSQVRNANGPFDEPNRCYEQARVFVRGGLYRQAALPFARVRALSPDNLFARLWLAQLYVMARQPDEALAVVREIRDQPDTFPQTKTNQTELVSVEAAAHLARGDAQNAEQVLEAALAKYPQDDNLLAMAIRVYTTHGFYTNALTALNRRLKTVPDDLASLMNKGQICIQLNVPDEAAATFSNALTVLNGRLKKAPDDPSHLLTKGFVYIQLNAFDEAASTLTHLLELQATNSTALFNRAIAYLRGEKLEAARQDYETLAKLFPTAYQVHFGLAEIAYRSKDTNAAIKYYGLYLANANTNSAESKLVSQRLKELKGGSP